MTVTESVSVGGRRRAVVAAALAALTLLELVGQTRVAAAAAPAIQVSALVWTVNPTVHVNLEV